MDLYVFFVDKTMVVRQTSKSVYLAVVILEETKLGINKSGTFVHLRLCKNEGKTMTDIGHKFMQMWQTSFIFFFGHLNNH